MTASLLLRFKPEIHLVETPQGSMALQDPPRLMPLDTWPASLVSALRLLTLEQGVSESVLTDQILKTGSGWQDLPQLHYVLENFQHQGLICHTLQLNDQPFATWVPLSAQMHTWPRFGEPLDPQTPYQISRFAYSRWDQGQMVLESPLAAVQIRLVHWQAGAILSLLASPCAGVDILAQFPDLGLDSLTLFLRFLISGQMVDPLPSAPLSADQSGLQYWEFHDLLFHSRSRLGRHGLITGKAYPFLEQQLPPPPPIKAYEGQPIPLYRPDLEILKQTDPCFTQVLESRRSQRAQGSDPITLEQLGEFLFRSAHVQGFVWRDHLNCTLRPYPSGGACGSLEIYPVVRSCQGLEPGLYHYNPHQHHLDPVAAMTPAVSALLTQAAQVTKGHQSPQILLVLASRFARVMWVYRGISYALILKDVGVLFQTMSLVATAMDLASCCLGAGDGDQFATAAATDYYSETSVGEFILASQAPLED